MRFYVATKLENHENASRFANLMKKRGWAQTYDWTTHGSVKETDEATLTSVGQKEAQGVRDADVLFLLTPQGRGSHVELGIAIALGKRIYVQHGDDRYFHCDDYTSPFYWGPGVIRFAGGLDELAERAAADARA